MSKEKKIKIVIISGSVRPDNNTNKAVALVEDEIKKHADIDVAVIDPNDLKLSLPGRTTDEDTKNLNTIVSQATGVILATPEYHGSYSSVIKLVIENLGYPSVLAGKPIALVGVASGEIGAIKALEHLRSVCSHIGAIVLPGQVSIASVDSVFDKAGKCLDQKVEQRIRKSALSLVEYVRSYVSPGIL